MTLLVCLDCTTAFAVGVPRCPHCGSERSAEEGTAAALGLHARGRIEEDDMPKITVHGGPSDRADITPEPEAPAAEGGEDVSAGSSGGTSSSKPSEKSEASASGRQRRARSAGSRSSKAKATSGTAGSTDTSGPETDAADA